jgi:hypothetical protein
VLDDYEADLRRDLGLPTPGAWRLQVQPLVGPGVVGLAGTF